MNPGRRVLPVSRAVKLDNETDVYPRSKSLGLSSLRAEVLAPLARGKQIARENGRGHGGKCNHRDHSAVHWMKLKMGQGLDDKPGKCASPVPISRAPFSIRSAAFRATEPNGPREIERGRKETIEFIRPGGLILVRPRPRGEKRGARPDGRRDEGRAFLLFRVSLGLTSAIRVRETRFSWFHT